MTPDHLKSSGNSDRLPTAESFSRCSQEMLQSVVDSTAAGIMVLDLEQQVIAINDTCVKLWGLPEGWAKMDDPAQRTLRMAEQTASPQAFLARAQELIEHPEMEDIGPISLKSSHHLQQISSPYRVGGILSGRLYTFFDITDIEQARLAGEAENRARSTFLASMSHEIRTPLSSMIGMTSLLSETSLTSEQRELVEIIRTSSETLINILNNILDFSKIEAGKFQLVRRPFDLRVCIEESLDIISGMLQEKKIELAYFMEPAVPEVILGDPTRLRQILINLMHNAVKFTDAGEVVIEVGIQPDLEAEDGKKLVRNVNLCRLHFLVRDTGIGIPPEKMAGLFSPFVQADVTVGARYGGTGLGLVISKQLVEMMGGRMWAESEGIPGHGSIFHFTLAAEVGLESRGTPQYFEQHHLKGKRILILTSNSANQMILSHYCEVWGAVPRLVEDARRALNLIYHGEVFDLAVLDMGHSEMGITMLARMIRQQREDLPLVLMTSVGSQHHIIAQDLFAARLSKPIKLSQLYDTLTSVLTHRAALRVEYPSPHVELDLQLARRYPACILVVEDDTVNRRLIQLMLSRMGYSIDLATNGLDALHLLQNGSYDVVFMDIYMPGLDGTQVTRQIRSELPAEKQPYIIALTADVLEGRRDYYLNLGMDDYLAKPLRIENVFRIMQHFGALRELDASVSSADRVVSSLLETSPVQMEIVEEWIQAIGSAPAYVSTVDLYLRDTPRLIAEMLHALDIKDWGALRGIAHAIKSSSGSMGAVRLVSMLEEMEIASIQVLREEQQEIDHFSELATQIEMEYQEVCQELSSLQLKLTDV